METSPGELQGSPTLWQSSAHYAFLGLPEFPNETHPTARITVHLGGSRERKGQQEAAGAGSKFSY